MNGRPGLLVSVRNAAEAVAAHAAGADWIDLKEPLAGSLGAVALATAQEILTQLPAERPVSAALGELIDWHEPTMEQFLALPGIHVVKLGLAGCRHDFDWARKWADLHRRAIDHGKQLAAVIYADEHSAATVPAREVLATAVCNGCQFLLLDTFAKSGGSVLEFLPPATLGELLSQAQRAGMQTVLAGSLKSGDLPQLVDLPINLVAVRGAVCESGRTGVLSAALVRQFHKGLRTTPCLSAN